jgi:cytochrome c
MRQYKIIVLATALSLIGVSAVQAEGTARPGGEKTASCEKCHGPRGCAPVQGLIPRLCGQNNEYLEAQLLEFQDGRRPQPIMHETTKLLSAETIKQLANYFANAPCARK